MIGNLKDNVSATKHDTVLLIRHVVLPSSFVLPSEVHLGFGFPCLAPGRDGTSDEYVNDGRSMICAIVQDAWPGQ